MKVGILGGTFNPIHNGHLYMGKCALEELELDKILYIPTGVSYLKNQNEILPKEIRYHMVSLACQINDRFEPSDIEINRNGNTYTYETLSELNQQHSDWQLYFIIGADTAYMIEKWVKPEKIMQISDLVILYREGQSLHELEFQCQKLEKTYNARCHLLKADAMNISSTEIRQMIRNGKDISTLVPDKLCEYIIDNKFYL